MAAAKARVPFYVDPGDAPAKRRILEEGLRLFSSQGVDGTSIRDISDAAGCTNPALYKHFGSKEELAEILFMKCYVEIGRRLDTTMTPLPTFDERIRAGIHCICELADAVPEALVYVNAGLTRFVRALPAKLHERSIPHIVYEAILLARKEGLIEAGTKGDEVRVASVAGTFFVLARMVHLRTIRGPFSRYEEDLVHATRQAIVG